MVRLPRSLQIGHHRYRVTSDPSVLTAADRKEHETIAPKCDKDQRLKRRYKIWGLYSEPKHFIYVARGQDDQSKRETLLHECIHAIWNLEGFYDHGHLSRYEERFVNAFTNQILDLLRSNPDLVKFLTEPTTKKYVPERVADG